jgi:cyclopropane fatty-acyl-phospholipid synthase-like methyltransferase
MNMDEVARQLRQPEGEAGVNMGLQMNKSNRLIYEMTLDFLALKPGEAVLEIGMGNGHFVQELFQRESSIRYTGIDMSDVMVAEAIRENRHNIHATFHCTKKIEGHFNKVFAVNVLYFWDQPADTLKEIHEALAPEGELVLAIRSKETMRLLPFVNLGFTLYDVESATRLLEDNGFKITEVITTIEPEKLAADGSKLVQLENICLRGMKN